MGHSSDQLILFNSNEVKKPKPTVLLIDDSIDILTVHQMMLEANGFTVITALSGAEGLDILFHSRVPDLILLDYQLEDMTGVEFLNYLEKSDSEFVRRVPVIFLTGMEAVPHSKAAGVIHKPADMNVFIQSVRHFIQIGTHAKFKK